MNNKIYFIKCVTNEGKEAYLIDHIDGLKFVTGGVHSDMTQFKTYEKAQIFLRKHKFNAKAIRAFIISN